MTGTSSWRRLALPTATGRRVARPRTWLDEVAAALSNRPLEARVNLPQLDARSSTNVARDPGHSAAGILDMGPSSWANLRRAKLRGANLIGADLAGVDLRRANLIGADLTGANLAGAILEGAKLSHASLRSANLTGADLRSANLFRANISSANLVGATLRKADLTEVDLDGAKLVDVDLRGALVGAARSLNVEKVVNVIWSDETFWGEYLQMVTERSVLGAGGGYVLNPADGTAHAPRIPLRA